MIQKGKQTCIKASDGQIHFVRAGENRISNDNSDMSRSMYESFLGENIFLFAL